METERNERTYDLKGQHIFIGLPAYDYKLNIRTAVSLARFAQEAPKHGIHVTIANISGCSIVAKARNLLVEEFLRSDATHLMFIDSDIQFDPNDIIRLLAWGLTKGIVGGVPRTRRPEDKVYIAVLDEINGENGRQLTMDDMGLVRAKRFATAFMMIQRKVFTDMVEAHPEWKYRDVRYEKDFYCVFDFKLTPDGYVGEDFLFCDRARELGHEVWIDPTIKLNHVGVIELEGDFGADVLYPMTGMNITSKDEPDMDSAA